MKKRSLFLFLLLFVLVPFTASANTFAYVLGDPVEEDSGITSVKIFIAPTQQNIDLNVETDSISCSVTNKLDCKIVATNGNTMNGDHIKGSQPFAANEEVGKVVVTNDSFEDVNNAKLIVTFGNSESMEKTVNVTGKEVPASNDATLKSVNFSVGELTPEFKSDVTQYTIYGISDTIRKIELKDYTCDKCSIKVEGGEEVQNNKTVILKDGENAVKITVTSQNGENHKTYNFTVIKGASSFNSNKLKSLTVGQYEISPQFNASTLEYEVKVPKKLTNIETLLNVTTEDSEAKYKVEGASNLDKDENEVTITVTARDGSTSVYKLKVIREDEVEAVIDVIGYKDNIVTFIDTEGNSKTLSIDEFKTQYPQEYEKIDNGTYKFDEDGNIIRESNNSNEEKKEENKKSNSFPWIIVVLIVVALIIIGVAGFFIFKDSDKDEDDEDKKNNKKKDEKEELTEEQKEELEDIDSYNEEARIIAEDNLRNEDKENTIEPDEIVDEEQDIKEEVVKTETVDEYVDEEKSATMDIDEALSDLMNTKEYNFKDK